MSVVSPSPSPSPTPPPAQSVSPHHPHQPPTKAGALLSAAKATLSEQSSRISLKHTTDLELLDDLRVYFKTRCSVERDYAQALAKLNSGHSKRSSQLLTYIAAEDEISNIKTIYTSWRVYQEDMEKHAKQRLAQFEQMASICESLKAMRSHKLQVAKKCLDSHLKKMQEEVINSVNEIDKTRKLYFEEEHLARQARDKEEKIKKRKTGIFSSFANLQNKKERTSAHREASDIQSTQARNDYIMALAAGNAHLEHYQSQDLTNLMLTIDDAVLDRCRGFMINLLQVERETVQSWAEVVDKANEMMEKTSADYTNSVFLRDPNSASLSETLLYEFQACDNDPVDTITLEHNADIALRNEGQKWFTWFSKECRNLNRLSAQLIRLQALLSEGHKSVEVPGHGQVDLESRIDDVRQQLRKSEISKMKAKARLQVIKASGAEVEDFENFESQVAMEIKQQSLDVDINLTSLSRTPSVKSNIGFENKTISRQETETAQSTVRPESSSSAEQLDSPDREVLQMGSSVECTSPAPTSSTYGATNQASWDYDPTQAWDDEPAFNGYQEGQAGQDDTDGILQKSESAEDSGPPPDTYYDNYETSTTTDGFTLVGKQCFALYSYTAQNEDELSITEQEILSVVNALDSAWVHAQNQQGQQGYVPAAYLQEMLSTESAGGDPSSPYSTGVASDQYQYHQSMESSVSVPDPADQTSWYQTPTPDPLPDVPAVVASVAEDSQELSSENSHVTYVKALYDYEATNNEEISFTAGEMVRIIDNSSDDGWWTGQNKSGQIGHFPSMLVAGFDDEEEEEEEEEEEDEEEDEDHPPPCINLPPVAPPNPEVVPPPVEMPASEPTLPAAPPPTFAPPPKPMQLMTPQAVVIIQPTPEIESRPVIGSEMEMEQQETAQNDQHESGEAGDEPIESAQDSEPGNSVSVAVAVAAHEVSESITQQAMDDSMRELSRRTSEASSYDSSTADGAPAATGAELNMNGDVEAEEEDFK